MRELSEIKFRGYGIDDKWHYGWLYQDGPDRFVIKDLTESYYLSTTGRDHNEFLVWKESVGQYTGLKDKNDKEIYDGDIVNFDSELPDIYKVTWNDEYARFELVGLLDGFQSLDMEAITDSWVIGNVHENPELLEATNG